MNKVQVEILSKYKYIEKGLKSMYVTTRPTLSLSSIQFQQQYHLVLAGIREFQ